MEKYMNNSAAITALCTLIVMVSGCSDKAEQQESEGSELSEVLSRMQGSWEAASTNGCTENCGAVVQGDTLRIRYQGSPESAMERHSVRIDRIDEQAKVLIINDGVGAWPYFYGIQDGQEYLEIEFYSRLEQAWHRLRLKRSV
jgi:hypothetical protein